MLSIDLLSQRVFLTAVASLMFAATACADQGVVREFRTLALSDKFYAESAALGDIDRDGDADIVYGPFWFEGPEFKKSHLIYKPNPFAVATYSNNFVVYAEDLDGDGWQDVLVLGFPRRKASTYWFKNPGGVGFDRLWEKFEVFDAVGNESPVWGDVTGDGKNEILCSMDGRFGFVAPADRSKPQLPWVFTPISPPKSTGGKFTHGLGFGDVNGDGRNDVLEKSGWWEQPEGGGLWKKHVYLFAPPNEKGGSQMFAYDFDGDGDNDVVSAINAHGYGLAWFEQLPEAGGEITFKQHLIMGSRAEESRFGVVFSQLHGVALEDIDGDGIKDIVTGKRFYAHGGKDPGGKDAPVIYWFQTVRKPSGVEFVPHLIHDASGVGTDVTTGDANGDGRMDIVIGNKKGAFVHLQTDAKAVAPKPVVHEKSERLVFEGEELKILKRTGSLKPQKVRGYGADVWSGDTQLWWTEGKPGEVIEFEFSLAESGTFSVGVGLTMARDYGIVQLALDGKKILEPIDLFSKEVAHSGTVVLGDGIELKSGAHQLSVTMVGANPEALQKFMFGLDYVVIGAKGKLDPPVAKPNKSKGVKEGNDLAAEAKTPAEQLASFTVPDGFVMELVASEETGIAKPTSIAFDDAGRLWVTTAVEYPNDQSAEVWKKKGRDVVAVIDSPQLPGPQPVRVFADGMVMPMSVLPMGDGAIVAQGPEIFYLEDNDEDGKSDGRQTLISGFGVQDTHTLPHQLARMPGGRVTFSQGVLNSGTIRDGDLRIHSFDRTLIASMTPGGRDFQMIGAGMNNIWAWAHSRVGEVFIHEANDLGFSMVPFEQDSSYPSFRMTKIHPDAPLHPPTAEGLNLGGTGFSGIAIADSLSGSFPAPHFGRHYVANPILGKINAVSGNRGEDGVWRFTKEEDLVSCSDSMFRPVCIAFGPDGCLYIADWYNRIISHNEVARDHPARDKEHGRIWRVRHVDATQPEIRDYTKVPVAELPRSLNSDNTWAMRAAWHQIGQRQDKTVLPELITMLRDANTRIDTKIHALWCVEELGHFDKDLWAELLANPSPDLRRETVRALSTLRVSQVDAAALLAKLAKEPFATVRYEVLRYFRRAEGAVSVENLAWLRTWTESGTGYQREFQNFLFKLVETKTQLPVMVKSKWGGVLEKNPTPPDPQAVANRIAAIRAELPKADIAKGQVLAQAVCLTCHAIGGKGVGFAPPLDGSANRDLEGLLTAIVDPDAAMENVFRNYRIVKADGTIIEGFNQGETASAIALLVMGGIQLVIPTNEIKSAGYIEGKSVMPDITRSLSPREVADLTAYLRSLQ